MRENAAVERQHAAPLRQQAVRIIRELILDGRVSPGERLIESALCANLQVSRTVVREALRQLESENLVSVVPNRGPIVAVLSKHDIESIYEVRARLEGLVAELFALRATKDDADGMIHLRDLMETDYLHGTVESRESSKSDFYNLLLKGAGNPVLSESLHAIHARIALFRRYAFVDEKRIAMSMEEISRIIEAAAVKRNPAMARQYAEEHILLAGKLAIVEYGMRLNHGDTQVADK